MCVVRAGMDAEDDLCDEFVRRAVAMRCAWCETDRTEKREKKREKVVKSTAFKSTADGRPASFGWD
jgi:hypothetical protein